jgi:hypothetical protein
VVLFVKQKSSALDNTAFFCLSFETGLINARTMQDMKVTEAGNKILVKGLH